MPSQLKLKWIAAIAAAVALLALPAAAQATLAFTRNPLKPVVYVGERQRLRRAQAWLRARTRGSPRTGSRSPTSTKARATAQELMLAPAARRRLAEPLMVGWQDPFYLAFSPDSKTIAALRGPELGKRKLVLIDVASGTQTVVASGYFGGFSFSPDGTELVYSKAGSEKYPPRSDVYRFEIPIGESVRVRPSGPPHPRPQLAQDPLWGPTGKIVFVKLLDAKQRKYGPKNELYLMNPDGKQVKRLTHTKVDPLLQGLYADRVVGQRPAPAGRVRRPGHDLRGHRQPARPAPSGPLTKEREVGLRRHRPLRRRQHRARRHRRLRTGPRPQGRERSPTTGGKPKVLANNASEPSWSR